MSDLTAITAGDAPPAPRVRPTLDAVVAAYIHEISVRHRRAEQADGRARAREGARFSRAGGRAGASPGGRPLQS